MDDDTLEILLGPGTMPGTEITQELPVLITEEFQPLPPHLANDPILTMPAPHATHPSLFDHVYGPGAPRMLPGKPMKRPRVPIRARDHVLAALGAGVVVLSVASYVLVESGWRSGMPESQRSQTSVSAPVTTRSPATREPDISQSPVTPVTHSIPGGVPVVLHARPQPAQHSTAPVSPRSAPTPSTPPPSPVRSAVEPSTPPPSPALSTPHSSLTPSPTVSAATGTPSPSPSIVIVLPPPSFTPSP